MVWWSSPPTTIRRAPSGEKLRQAARRSATFCSLVISRPVRESQMQTDACRPICPVATVRPSGCNAMLTMSVIHKQSVNNEDLQITSNWRNACVLTVIMTREESLRVAFKVCNDADRSNEVE